MRIYLLATDDGIEATAQAFPTFEALVTHLRATLDPDGEFADVADADLQDALGTRGHLLTVTSQDLDTTAAAGPLVGAPVDFDEVKDHIETLLDEDAAAKILALGDEVIARAIDDAFDWKAWSMLRHATIDATVDALLARIEQNQD